MSEGVLKTAILGLNAGGRLLLEAAGRVDSLRVAAVADKDANLAERIAEECGCEPYDDYRQLVISNELDCLLVAAPMHSCEEYVRMAMKKGFNVLKLPPGARDFEEAAEFVRLGEEQQIQFAIANLGRFAQSFTAMRRFLEENGTEQFFLMTAFCNAGDVEPAGWQADPKLAGGGVLMHNCYRLIDQIVSNFGMPEQVYSLSTNQARDKQQRLYLTEDTAVATMKFRGGSIGNLVASRRPGTGRAGESLTLYGDGRTLTASDSELIITDGRGREIEHLRYHDSPIVCMSELLKNFAKSVLWPDENRPAGSGRENLKNIAVIESAYLSARTGFPEEPERILQLASARVEEPESA